jgi:hypothetical protein
MWGAEVEDAAAADADTAAVDWGIGMGLKP